MTVKVFGRCRKNIGLPGKTMPQQKYVAKRYEHQKYKEHCDSGAPLRFSSPCGSHRFCGHLVRPKPKRIRGRNEEGTVVTLPRPPEVSGILLHISLLALLSLLLFSSSLSLLFSIIYYYTTTTTVLYNAILL